MWLIKDWQDNFFPDTFETYDEALEFLVFNLDQQNIDYDVVSEDYEIIEDCKQ